MDSFKVGDQVRLNVGNTPMLLVNQVNADGTVDCVWIANGVPYSARYAERVLRKYE